jgi:hypothetical protein
MVHLIDKDALVAWAKETYLCENASMIRKVCYKQLLEHLDTLEVKEVDEQKERMSECPYRKVGCTMYEGKILECKGACSWVVDYPKLKELKAQKGE